MDNLEKRKPYRNKRILEFSKGQPCTLEIPGVCNHNPETTVFCHFNKSFAGKGMGQKADDCAGVIACSSCHDVIDFRANMPNGQLISLALLNTYLLRGYYRTIRRLIDGSILK